MLSAFEASMERDPDRPDASQLHPAVVAQPTLVIEPTEEKGNGSAGTHKPDEVSVSSTQEVQSDQQTPSPKAVTLLDAKPSNPAAHALVSSHAESGTEEVSLSPPGEPKAPPTARPVEGVSNSAAPSLGLGSSDSGEGAEEQEESRPSTPTIESTS